MTYSWYVRRLHPSWLLAALFFGITGGVIGSLWLRDAHFISFAWLLGGIVLAGLGLWRRRAYLLVAMVVAGGMVGLWRGGSYAHQLEPYARLRGQTVVMAGKVTDDADEGKKGELVLRLGNIEVNGRPLEGTVWVSASVRAAARRSDVISVKGKLAPGFGSFAASMYRAEVMKIERPQPGDAALRARDWFAGGIRRAITEPEASLGVGFVVGQRRSLPEELDTSLRAAGLTHIVVASGYNLTILVGLARRMFEKVSKFLAAFFGGGMIVGFMAVTGLSPSMSRAGLVTGLSLLAWYYGRRFHPLVLLPLAAAMTLLINPSYGWNDLGWQLSFASFAGVLIVAPLFHSYFFGAGEPGVIRQVLIGTVSAWLATVPLIAMAFGQFSNVALMANLLVLPLVPLAMLLVFLAGAGALLVPPLASILGFPAFMVLGYMTRVADGLGNLSWAQTTLTITPAALVFYYVVMIGFCGYMWLRTRLTFMEQTATD